VFDSSEANPIIGPIGKSPLWCKKTLMRMRCCAPMVEVCSYAGSSVLTEGMDFFQFV
jgi:hypothetical protein